MKDQESMTKSEDIHRMLLNMALAPISTSIAAYKTAIKEITAYIDELESKTENTDLKGCKNMTPEEAITELKESYVLTNGKINGKPLFESIEIAISALEKQIPTKTRKQHPQIKSYIPSCGSCGGIMDLLQGELNYCPNCGQAIDWEDEE